MSDLKDDLDATADSVVHDAERLIAIEREKQDAAGTARGDALGEEAVRLADSLSRKVRAEATIADRMVDRND
jgi:hypothetical protein